MLWISRMIHLTLRTSPRMLATTYSTKIVSYRSHRPGQKAITSSRATVRPIVTCPANNENSEDRKGISTFIHSGKNKYANDGYDSIIQNVSHNVMHNSEFNGAEQKEFQDIGA